MMGKRRFLTDSKELQRVYHVRECVWNFVLNYL